MFTDFVTISVGKLDNEAVRSAWYSHMRNLMKTYSSIFTSNYYGTYCINLPGRYWQSVPEEQGHCLVADLLISISGAHVTRFDAAHDWSLPEEQTRPIWRAFGKSLHINRIQGDGKTWYSGSRESPFYARLYDKRKEIRARTGIDVDFPLLRFECECKRSAAPEMYHHFLRDKQAVTRFLAERYHLEQFIPTDADTDSSEILHRLKQPEVSPFTFVRRFQRAIRSAQVSDPKLFRELFPDVVSQDRVVTA